jgi:hypothetical protein
MSGINTGKVIVGGLVAGVVLNVIDFVVNGLVLGAQWTAATVERNVDPAAIETSSMIGWITSDLLMGLAIVWLYAAIRPRFGPGPGTAVCVGLVVWAISHIAYFSLAFTGMYPTGVVMISTLGALISYLAGAYVGCRMYTESPQTHGVRA